MKIKVVKEGADNWKVSTPSGIRIASFYRLPVAETGNTGDHSRGTKYEYYVSTNRHISVDGDGAYFDNADNRLDKIVDALKARAEKVDFCSEGCGELTERGMCAQCSATQALREASERATVAGNRESQSGHYVNRDGEAYVVYETGEQDEDAELYHLRKYYAGAGYTGVTRAEIISQQYNGWLTFVRPLSEVEKFYVEKGRDVVTGAFGEFVQRTENAGQFVPVSAVNSDEPEGYLGGERLTEGERRAIRSAPKLVDFCEHGTPVGSFCGLCGCSVSDDEQFVKALSASVSPMRLESYVRVRRLGLRPQYV